MNRLQAIIVDDEVDSISVLQADLAIHCPEVNLIATCQDAKSAIKTINQTPPDLVFLDIDMPYINGFEMLEMIPEINFAVIFTTAYEEYAIRAFRISAVDYLLKPFAPEALQQAVQKAALFLNKGIVRQQLHFFKNQLRDLDQNQIKRVAIPTDKGIEFAELDDIIYCGADGSYTRVHRRDHPNLYLAKTLRYLEDILAPFDFFRVHNSYLINLAHVRQLVREDGGYLVMSNGDKVKISRSKKEELISALSPFGGSAG